MNLAYDLPSIWWEFAIWALLAIAAAALMAVVSPRLFSALNAWSGAWIDVGRLTKTLDKRVNIERHVLAGPNYSATLVGQRHFVAGFGRKL